MNLEQKIDKLAELAVRVGVNVLEGDIVQVFAPVERVDITRRIVEHAYKAGAKEVIVDFEDDYKKLLDFTYSPTEVMKVVHDFEYERNETLLKSGVKQIFVRGVNPELLKNIDSNKISEVQTARKNKLQPLMKYRMNDIVSWTIISAPTEDWAKLVFPNSENPVNDLWEAIFETTRVNKENPFESWENNLKTLSTKAQWLNEENLKSLHYTSSNGTDLVIGLPEGHIWRAAVTANAKGEKFVPNMPTEEVYSMPHRERIDGIVYSSKPLAYSGNVIDEFWIKFENGKAVDFDAKKGKDALAALLKEDENAVSLGEVALVPYDSPISNSNILFYNTLFDENASCHIALGAAYPTTIKNGENMTVEELLKNGVNQSIVHVDFMIGTKDLSIVGEKYDGTKIKVFENGNWA